MSTRSISVERVSRLAERDPAAVLARLGLTHRVERGAVWIEHPGRDPRPELDPRLNLSTGHWWDPLTGAEDIGFVSLLAYLQGRHRSDVARDVFEALAIGAEEAAWQLGCNVREVWRLVALGSLDAWRFGRTRRITRASLAELAARRRRGGG